MGNIGEGKGDIAMSCSSFSYRFNCYRSSFTSFRWTRCLELNI